MDTVNEEREAHQEDPLWLSSPVASVDSKTPGAESEKTDDDFEVL
jgi:hypothetical protein